jgi:hypothetical protein
MAATLVVAASLVRPAAAYGLGTELQASWCSPNTGSNEKTGPLPDAWHISRLKPSQVWTQNDAQGRPITGTGITIAVIDTAAQIGISPFLRAPSSAAGVTPTWRLANYVGDDVKVRQTVERDGTGLDCAHGTRVVSLINGQVLDQDDSNFSGMAPGSSVIVMRALTSSSSNVRDDQAPLAAAITDAVNSRVDVINISQEGSDDTAVRDAVASAIAHGIVVVASSGNSGNAGPLYPAAYSGVISVGMTTSADAPHPSSEEGVGVNVTVAAPGDAIVALLPSGAQGTTSTDAYLKVSQIWNTEPGTSFAAPIVTGVVALMLQKAEAEGVKLTPAEVAHRLELTADPPPGAVPDAQLGYGTVNPERAVFGPFPESAAVSAVPTSTPTAKPLDIPAGRDTTPMVIAVAVTLGVLALLAGALLVREAITPMRRRTYAPARADES